MGRSRPNFSPKLEPIHRTRLYYIYVVQNAKKFINGVKFDPVGLMRVKKKHLRQDNEFLVVPGTV